MALYNGLEECVPSLAHFSPCLSPRLAASPLLSKDRNRRSLTRDKLTTRTGGWGREHWEMERMEIDREDDMRQGRTLPQQGVRRRANTLMLHAPGPRPISSHYYFIPPSHSTSHPHFFLFVFFAVTFSLSCCQGQTRRVAQETELKLLFYPFVTERLLA